MSTNAITFWHRAENVKGVPRYTAGFHLGSENADGSHRRDLDGWPYSVFIEANATGVTDAVVAHGIQDLADARRIRDLLNAAGGWVNYQKMEE